MNVVERKKEQTVEGLDRGTIRTQGKGTRGTGTDPGTPKRSKTLSRDILLQASLDAFKKLNPVVMIKNPVMFIVEVGTLITLLLCINPDLFVASEAGRGYNIAVFLILLFTLLFANFAEALAEGRGKAQADTLRKTKSDTTAKLVQKDGTIKQVSSTQLKKEISSV